jgi:hypothetical protein
MAAISQKAAGAGFRHARIYQLDSNGLGLVPATYDADTAYDGVCIELPKALTLTVPDPQTIAHTGADRVAQVVLLPPTEAVTGELRAGHTDLEVEGIVGGTKVQELADFVVGGVGTDQQGKEPDVGVLGYRQAAVTDPSRADRGSKCWIFNMLPKATLFAKGGPAEEGGADENTFTVQPKVVSAFPWLIEFTCADNGFLEAQVLKGVSQYRPHLAYWKGDATETAFDFTYTAAATTKVKVYHWVLSTGIVTDVTATVTITTADITFGTAPAAGDIVIAFYEMADAVC